MMRRGRKIIAVLLVLALLVVPVAVMAQTVPAVAIWGVSMAGAAWSAVSELSVTVRAALAAPAFYSAATWVTSTLAPAAASIAVPMVCVAFGAAAGTAIGLFGAWLIAHNYTVGPDGSITQGTGVSTWHPAEGQPAGLSSYPWSGGTAYVSVYPSTEATSPYGAWVVLQNNYGPCASGGWCPPHYTHYKGVTQYPNTLMAVRAASTVTGSWEEGQTPVSDTQVKTTMQDDLVSTDPDTKARAQDALIAAITSLTDAFNEAKRDNTWPPPAMPGTNPIPQQLWDAWENAFKEGISQTDKTDMASQDTTANYGKDALNPPLAVVGVNNPAVNNVNVNVQFPEFPVPDPPPAIALGGDDPDPPDKMSLTTILQDYTDNLETLPIVGIVSGAHLEISGADPLLDLPVTIPPNPPVNVRIDFSKYESIVDTLGTLMLTYVSIIWTVWLFKGRGDA